MRGWGACIKEGGWPCGAPAATRRQSAATGPATRLCATWARPQDKTQPLTLAPAQLRAQTACTK
eukprot:15481340-Alexandrium_andersonii.AAC.1